MGKSQSPRRRAVFLDRDGVINRNIFNPATGQYEAPLVADDFLLLPGVPRALRRLRQAGFPLFLVSNQPNYAKGKSTLAELDAIDSKFRRELASMRVEFSAIYYCLHHPGGVVEGYSGPCACRKPSPYFLLRAMREFGIDDRQSWMLGDRSTDIACGRAAGVRTILIGANGDCGVSRADKIAADLVAATEYILESAPGRRW